MDGDRRPFPGKPICRTQPRPIPPTDRDALERTIRAAGCGGCVDMTSHFKMRAAQRGFTTPDVMNVLRRGEIIGEPEYCPEFCNWKLSVRGEHDDGCLILAVAVSAGDQCQTWSQSVMLITGYIRSGGGGYGDAQ